MTQLPACLRAPGLAIRAAHITQHAEEKAEFLHSKLFIRKVNGEGQKKKYSGEVALKSFGLLRISL